jgi:hypothetical protein
VSNPAMDLERARSQARAVRFGADHPQGKHGTAGRFSSMVAANLSAEGLEVASAVLPGVEAALQQTCERLLVPRVRVVAFVVPDPVIQATCYQTGDDGCTVTVTSGLVQITDNVDELSFVLGHELGHFLLAHRGLDGSPANLRASRAQEISADRLGLLASGKVDVALRAVMKTLSGLGREHLRFDVSAFLSSSLERLKEADQSSSTHPALPLRARCLLRFDAFLRTCPDRDPEAAARSQFDRFDEQVQRDVQELVDGPLNRNIERAEDSVRRWTWITCAVGDGALTKEEQRALREVLGPDALDSLIGLLSNRSAEEAFDLAQQRLQGAVHELNSLAIGSGSEVLERTAAEILADGRIDGSIEAFVAPVTGSRVVRPRQRLDREERP